MLTITIPPKEYFIEETQNFLYSPEKQIKLEHSLVSISKWEAHWKKPFLSDEDKTTEEFIHYVKCMTITQNVEDLVYYSLTKENMLAITDYINESRTATTVYEPPENGRSKQIITSELIYYWMSSLNIPFECQKWHLSRLLMYIKVTNAKQNPIVTGKQL